MRVSWPRLSAVERALARVAVMLLALLLGAGCTTAERACTDIGSVSGVAVTVDPAMVADLSRLTLRVCWDLGTSSPPCRTVAVELTPGTDSVDQGCEPGGPAAPCSATVVPNGSLVGFVPLEIREGRITVAATATVSGRQSTFPRIDRTAASTYPNGPDCGAGGVQATVAVGPDGLR